MSEEYRCRSGRRNCVGRTPDGPALTSRPESLCHGCVEDVQKCYDQLPDLAAALRVFLGGGMKSSNQSKVAATREPAAPLNVMVDALLGDIEDVQDRTEGRSMRDLITLPTELFKLWDQSGSYQQLVYLDGVDRALDVRKIYLRVVKVLGLGPAWQRFLAPCGICGLPTLGTWVGSGIVECGNCNTSVTMEAYESSIAEHSKKR